MLYHTLPLPFIDYRRLPPASNRQYDNKRYELQFYIQHLIKLANDL